MICAQCTEVVPDDAFCPSCGKAPQLEGKYRLEEVVGHGANGTTYRATRLADGQVVAIKELLVRKVESLKAVDLFAREVRVLSELDHPGVPDFIENLDVAAGRSVSLYLVQEFIDGSTLEAEFATRRGTEREVFELAAELLDTLSYLHALRPPVIHRDIKPGNVMRRASDGSLVLIDFGSVRDAVDTAEGGSTVAGTFGYMAPEQFAGRAIPATDIYGVGATIVALLSRQDPQELIGADRTIDWKGKLGMSPPFAGILERMLAENPNHRASDAGAVAREIRAALRGDVVTHAPSSAVALRGATGLAEVPPPPRDLPPRFRKTYVANGAFNLMFGGIFMVVGILAALVPLIVAIATGQLPVLLMSLLFGGIFGGTGAAFLASGNKSLKAATQAYQNGTPAEAVVMSIGSSTYRVNDRAATVYGYEFVAAGQVHRGEFHSWEGLDLAPGSSVTVLFDAADPSSNVLFDPERHLTGRRIRSELLAAQQRRDALLAESREVDKVVLEVAEEEDAQAW